MKHFKTLLMIAAATFAFTACKKDIDPVFPPAADAEIQLNGIAAAEPGSAAGNSVYLDLSAAKQKTVLRSSWDIGFYCGADFRVILNNTSVAGAKVLGANDITAVGAADTIGLVLNTSQTNPLAEQMAFFDDISGDITKTVIPAVSAVDADNKVIIINNYKLALEHASSLKEKGELVNSAKFLELWSKNYKKNDLFSFL